MRLLNDSVLSYLISKITARFSDVDLDLSQFNARQSNYTTKLDRMELAMYQAVGDVTEAKESIDSVLEEAQVANAQASEAAGYVEDMLPRVESLEAQVAVDKSDISVLTNRPTVGSFIIDDSAVPADIDAKYNGTWQQEDSFTAVSGTVYYIYKRIS